MSHPCFTCPLPDCDDTSRRCPLRKSLSVYNKHQQRRMPITDELRARRTVAFGELVRPEKAARIAERRQG